MLQTGLCQNRQSRDWQSVLQYDARRQALHLRSDTPSVLAATPQQAQQGTPSPPHSLLPPDPPANTRCGELSVMFSALQSTAWPCSA